MNDQPGPDQFDAWRRALAAGTRVEYTKGAPVSGYYKRRARNDDRSVRFDAVGIWQDGEEWFCYVSAGYTPRNADEIEELFVSCNGSPISYDLFLAICAGTAWPDEIAPVEVAPDLEPHARADAELTAQREALAAWIKEIGKVATQEQADKAAKFADLFARCERDSDAARKLEKQPHKDAANAVDEKWQPVVKRAAELKVYAKKATEAFLIAERARLAEEKRKADEAIAKAKREEDEARRRAEAAGAPPPAPVAAPAPLPPAQKAKAGKVHIRTVTVHEIVDMRAVLEFLARFNDCPTELREVAQLLVNRMRTAGVEVPGVETKTVERAA